MNKELCFTSKWNLMIIPEKILLYTFQAKAKYKLREKKQKTYRAQGGGVGGGP